MQTLIVIGIVLAALAYLGSRGWRAYATARSSGDDGGCAGGCGCGDKH
jgi:hypothetical protein